MTENGKGGREGDGSGEGIEKTLRIISTDCLLVSWEELVELIRGRSRERGRSVFDFTNTHIVAMRHVDDAFREATAGVDYFVPDSQALFFTIRMFGGGMEKRIYGPEFLDRCVRACGGSMKHYFLGGSEECLERLLTNLRSAVPEADIVGSHHGYICEEDDAGIVAEINSCSPDIIWVGMGTPKQQEWIARNRGAIERGCLLAVGFAFDVNAGMKRDAPPWMQAMALTWLFRMFEEPGRLWKRYLKYNSIYLWYLARQILSGDTGGVGMGND